MIQFTVEQAGWLFERPDIEAAVIPAVSQGTELVFNHARGLLAMHRGPGRRGHAVEALAKSTYRSAGVGITGRVFGKGAAAFKLIFLEHGTVGHFISPRRRQGALAFSPPGGTLLFRPYVHHPGAPAQHWSTQTQRDTSASVVGLIEDAIRRVTEQ